MNNETKRVRLLSLLHTIESDLEDAQTYGMDSPNYWYAEDRVASIMDYCQEYFEEKGNV